MRWLVTLSAVSSENQSARCAWCGATAQPYAAGLAACPACGTATTFPAPSDAELELAYAHYRPPSGRFAGGGDRVLALSRASLARRLERITPPGPILDVGSGDGSLLHALRAQGREAIGLERASSGDGVTPARSPTSSSGSAAGRVLSSGIRSSTFATPPLRSIRPPCCSRPADRS